MILIDKTKPDWNRIKAEYKSSTKSLRDLSNKHNIPWSTLRARAYREKWGEERKKVQTKVEQNVVNKVAKKTVDNATLAADIKRKGLLIIDGLFDDFASVMATEHRESRKGVTNIKRLRDLTAAYKDLTDDMTSTDGAGNELLQSLLALERKIDRD